MTITHGVAAATEQTRARYPDAEGHVERDGVRIVYEVYGEGETTVLLMPTWSIIHSRFWKMQIPYLARRFRVVVFDGRGNGKSDRPQEPEAYAETEFAADALAVLDATATERAVVASLSRGRRALAAPRRRASRAGRRRWPSSVRRCRSARRCRGRGMRQMLRRARARRYEGWDEVEPPLLASRTTRTSSSSSSRRCSTSRTRRSSVEDAVGWGLETDAETLVATPARAAASRSRGRCASWRTASAAPCLVIHGRDDAIRPHDVGAALAEMTGGALVTLEGSGHIPLARDPVKVNLLLRDFVERTRPPTQASAARSSTWFRGRSAAQAGAVRLLADRPRPRAPRRRDRQGAAPARARPRDRLARPASGDAGARRGGRAHPSRERRARERVRTTSRASRPSTTCTPSRRSGAWTRSCCANYMVFDDLVTDEHYDLWIADEGWEIDYYLHENPERKRAAYVWLTDFVGWLPMPDGGEREAFVTADYNAEMIEHIARFPRVRDRALFVGNPRRRRARQLRAGPADDPRLDRAALRVPRLRERVRPEPVRRPRAAARRARLRARRARLHRHRRRLGRRRGAAPARDRRASRGAQGWSRTCG